MRALGELMKRGVFDLEMFSFLDWNQFWAWGGCGVSGFFSSFQCDSYEIRPGKHLGVCISVANNRLFVGSIPKNKTKENILEEFSKVTGKTKMYLEISFGKSVVHYKCKKRRCLLILRIHISTGCLNCLLSVFF